MYIFMSARRSFYCKNCVQFCLGKGPLTFYSKTNALVSSRLTSVFHQPTFARTLLKRQFANYYSLSSAEICGNGSNQINSLRNLTTDDKKSTSDENLTPVYEGPLSKPIRIVKLFSISTSILGIGMQPTVWNYLLDGNSLALAICFSAVSLFFIAVNPLMLHWVSKRYVIELQVDKETKRYRAFTYTFFCRQQHFDFKIEDVIHPDKPMFFTSIVANGQPIFIDPRLFSDVDVYKQLMGYDKPMNYFLKEDEKN